MYSHYFPLYNQRRSTMLASRPTVVPRKKPEAVMRLGYQPNKRTCDGADVDDKVLGSDFQPKPQAARDRAIQGTDIFNSKTRIAPPLSRAELDIRGCSITVLHETTLNKSLHSTTHYALTRSFCSSFSTTVSPPQALQSDQYPLTGYSGLVARPFGCHCEALYFVR